MFLWMVLSTDSKDNNISALDLIIDHKSEESFEQIEKERKNIGQAIENSRRKKKWSLLYTIERI